MRAGATWITLNNIPPHLQPPYIFLDVGRADHRWGTFIFCRSEFLLPLPRHQASALTFSLSNCSQNLWSYSAHFPPSARCCPCCWPLFLFASCCSSFLSSGFYIVVIISRVPSLLSSLVRVLAFFSSPITFYPPSLTSPAAIITVSYTSVPNRRRYQCSRNRHGALDASIAVLDATTTPPSPPP